MQDEYYIIYSDGQYIDSEGNPIALEELDDLQKEIVLNRIIREIRQTNFYPSSIVEIRQTDYKNGKHFFPELILVNDSVCILTGEDGQGWTLESGDFAADRFRGDTGGCVWLGIRSRCSGNGH